MTAGNNYIALIDLRAADNYTFADDCEIRVNGKAPMDYERLEIGGVNGLRVYAGERNYDMAPSLEVYDVIDATGKTHMPGTAIKTA